MASLIRPTRPYPLPPNAEFVTKDGRQHVRTRDGGKVVLYPLTKDGTKYLKPASKWYGQYTDATGVVRREPLSPNKDAARLMLAGVLKRVELEKGGHKDAFAPHRKTALTTHLADWLAVLAARGRDAEYTALKKSRVQAILDGCSFVLPADLSADRLERFLEALRTGEKNLSVQTTNDYLQAASQFCNWLVENDRLEKNPFARVKKGNAERDRRHVRRVLDVAELRALIAATRAGGIVRRKLSAADRAMLYAVGAYTGYRAAELAALVPECFVLDGPAPVAELDGKYTKNGKPACQPIPPELAAELRPFLSGRPAGVPVWPGTWVDRAADVIAADATAAGIPVTVDTKDGPQVLDFHSLRGTYATLLDGLDISLKARQDLMRHSDPRLTLNRYTRAKLHDLTSAAGKFPSLTPDRPAPASDPAQLRATGTDPGCTAYVLPDALTGGSGRLRVRTGEETTPGESGSAGTDQGSNKPPHLQGFEDGRGALTTNESGEGGSQRPWFWQPLPSAGFGSQESAEQRVPAVSL